MSIQTKISKVNAVSFLSLCLVLGMTLFVWAIAVHAAIPQSSEAASLAAEGARNMGWAFFSSALAVGISSIAAGIAVAYVGAAAVGAITEKPEMTGKVMIFVGLAEGIAIYGLIIAIMILGKV